MVAAGRLSYEKGHDILIKAVQIAKNLTPEFYVDIFGLGPEMESLKKLSRQLGVDHLIHLRGFVDDIKPIFREADLMVLPSRSEGMPYVILEAWSQKLAVLSTAVGGVPQMIEDGHNGFIVPPEDTEVFAQKLTEILRNPNKLIEVGQRGFDTAQSRYNFESQAKLLERVYAKFVDMT